MTTTVVINLNLRFAAHFKFYWVPEGSLAGFVGSVFGVWAAPAGFKTIQKCGGLRPPHFWMVIKPPGAAQAPNTDPKNAGQTAFRYPVLIMGNGLKIGPRG